MLTITLICNLGMSTSMLVDKMSEVAKAKGLAVDIDALPFDKIDSRIDHTDILLLGPQVRYLLGKFQKEYGSIVPVIEVMNMADYALVKGEKMLEEAISKYEANKPRA